MPYVCKICKDNKKPQPQNMLWLDVLNHFRKDGSVHQELWNKEKTANYDNMAERMRESEILKHVEYRKEIVMHESDNTLEDDIPAVPEDEMPKEIKETRDFVEKHKKKKR